MCWSLTKQLVVETWGQISGLPWFHSLLSIYPVLSLLSQRQTVYHPNHRAHWWVWCWYSLPVAGNLKGLPCEVSLSLSLYLALVSTLKWLKSTGLTTWDIPLIRATLLPRLLWQLGGPTMSRPQTQEQTVDSEGDSSLHRRDEEGPQSSHRMLGFSDALLSIIATVMVSAGSTPGFCSNLRYPHLSWSWGCSAIAKSSHTSASEYPQPKKHLFVIFVFVPLDPACDPHRDLTRTGNRSRLVCTVGL